MKKIEIKTNRLILRPVRAEDLYEINDYACDKSIEMMLFLPNSSIEETKDFIKRAVSEWEDEEAVNWEFVITLDGKIIGGMGIEYAGSKDVCEIGWVLHKDYRGMGYATEAAKAMVQFTIDVLKPKTIIAHCDDRNNASKRVMEKLGMKLKDDTHFRVYPKTGVRAKECLYEMYI